MTRIEPRLLKGFRDYEPLEQAGRQRLFSAIQNRFERFGFLPLSTPALEYQDILMGKYGEGEKLVYSFTDNGGRQVALRYDLTVPLARYVALNQGDLLLPFKRYQIAPVWRADKPQKGRFREFFQCDVDVVGTDSLLADAEVIACLCSAISAAGAGEFLVRLNDRRLFNLLSDSLAKPADAPAVIRAVDKIDKIGLSGVMEELAELDLSDNDKQKIEAFLEVGTGQEALQKLTSIFGETATEIVQRTEQLLQLLAEQGIGPNKIAFDPTIARGLNYYTSTVFEIILPQQPEYGSICSGGRYDGLVDQFSNRSIPGVGGSIGIDRLYEALQEQQDNADKQDNPIAVLIMNQDINLFANYLSLSTQLREAGVPTELYYENDKLDKQFRYAEAKKIPYAIIMGPEEVFRGTVQLKSLADRQQQELTVEQLLPILSK